MLESVYEALLAHRLQKAGLRVERQVVIPIIFDGVRFEEAFRADLLVEGKVIIELKSVETIAPVHQKQLVTYLRLSGLNLGYLLNFGAATMKEGIQRVINGTIA